MLDLGVRLQLLIGPTIPIPASYDVVDALDSLEVRNNDRERDGFQFNFSLGRESASRDYLLLEDEVLDPPNRVCIVVIIRGLPQVLINGIITRHQVMPSNQAGQSRLVVTGEDTGLLMDKEEKSDVFRNMPDSEIVNEILERYADLEGVVTQTQDTPNENQHVVTQHESDLAFIRRLARRNSFVFYTEPTEVPGRSKAYWGPKDQPGSQVQSALNMNLGADTNIDQLSFDYDALKPVKPQITILDPLSGRAIPVPVPDLLGFSLSNQPAEPLRTVKQRDTANLDMLQASLRANMAVSEGADAVAGQGEVDAVRYGCALRSRHCVGVRGVGKTYDGDYYIPQVTHRIRRGEYKQSFSLSREGRGATKERVIS